MGANITNKKCYFYSDIDGEGGFSRCSALKPMEANCRGCIFFRDKEKDVRNNVLMAIYDQKRQADYSAGLCSKPRTRSL